MCTVTYVPNKMGYFLTSNRDEKSTRSAALAPLKYNLNGKEFIFPKDKDAGGTWITLKENGDSLCLLNGAFTYFDNTEKYTISRGKIVLQIAVEDNLVDNFKKINLVNTAPFTLIIIQSLNLFECRWDGQKKHTTSLQKNKPSIWSSATLYDNTMQAKRKKWFEKWLSKQENILQKNILVFHTNTGEGDKENDLVMNRNNETFTVSITSIKVRDESISMHYKDLINDSNSTIQFNRAAALIEHYI